MLMTKKVKIIYFAALREQSDKSEEYFETQKDTLEDLYKELQEKYSFTLGYKDIKVALNEVYADFQSVFSDGDTVVFVPPVAGG